MIKYNGEEKGSSIIGILLIIVALVLVVALVSGAAQTYNSMTGKDKNEATINKVQEAENVEE